MIASKISVITWNELQHEGESPAVRAICPDGPHAVIVAGLGEYFELPGEEMDGERFDVPAPDGTVFISWFEGGEVFRSGPYRQRGHERIFGFRSGHEAYPTCHDAGAHSGEPVRIAA